MKFKFKLKIKDIHHKYDFEESPGYEVEGIADVDISESRFPSDIARILAIENVKKRVLEELVDIEIIVI